jgi:phosphate transport system protein
LERIGDYACHLAKLAVKGDREIYKDFIEPISTMAKSGAMMIRNSITAYIEDNEPLALETAKKDAEIDHFKKNIISHLLLQNPQNEAEMKQLYRYISICKDLERLGDHITTICEWVVFTVRGEMVDLGKMKEK